jgi:hypothetical protein
MLLHIFDEQLVVIWLPVGSSSWIAESTEPASNPNDSYSRFATSVAFTVAKKTTAPSTISGISARCSIFGKVELNKEVAAQVGE